LRGPTVRGIKSGLVSGVVNYSLLSIIMRLNIGLRSGNKDKACLTARPLIRPKEQTNVLLVKG